MMQTTRKKGMGLHWLLASLMTLASTGCDMNFGSKPKVRYENELQQIHRVAVVPFVDAPGPKGKGSGNIVVNGIMGEFHHCPGLDVVERSELDRIMQERDWQTSQMQDTTKASTLGQIVRADAIVLGEVTQYEAQQEYAHGAVHMFSAGGTRHVHRVGLSIRMVDVKTGRVLYVDCGDGHSEEGFSDAARRASARAVRRLKQFYEDKHDG